jgi:hypothetical protein
MHLAAYVAIFVGVFMSMFLAFLPLMMMSAEKWEAAQEKARARRMAEHKMNARLLRLNL